MDCPKIENEGLLLETFDKLKSIIADQLSVDPSIISMDAQIHRDLGADELDVIELGQAIEEEFDIEIPYDLFHYEPRNVRHLLSYLLLHTYNISLEKLEKEIAERVEVIRRGKKVLKLISYINTCGINKNEILEVISHENFISQFNKIKELSRIIDKSGTNIVELGKYAEIFQNGFIVSHLEQISSILSFLEQAEISSNEAAELIQDKYLESYQQKVDLLKNAIHRKEVELQNKKTEIKNKQIEVQKQQNELKELNIQAQVLTNEAHMLQQELEHFLENGFLRLDIASLA